MKLSEHLLTILAEECNEVAHRCSKALRFGLSEKQEGQDKDNATRILDELIDLTAVASMLIERDLIPKHPAIDTTNLVHAKKCNTIDRYLEYSKQLGTLDGLQAASLEAFHTEREEGDSMNERTKATGVK